MDLLTKIATDLKVDLAYISKIAIRSNFYYRTYKIPKRNGGEREISQPSPELKTLQYWVLKNILSQLPVSDCAKAYKRGDSIKKHALCHRNSKHIFHTDISNFFPSITIKNLENILKNNKNVFKNLDLDVEQSIDEIRQICFKNNRLCIGSVTAPIISNIIMYDFDSTVSAYCVSMGCIYTRYADDIYISSTSYINENVKNYIANMLNKYGFITNNKKTHFYSKKYRQKITGITLTTDGQISIGTKNRHKIKKMVYDKLKKNIGDSETILGYLAFLKDVEPHTYNNLIIKYSKYCDGDIIEELRK